MQLAYNCIVQRNYTEKLCNFYQIMHVKHAINTQLYYKLLKSSQALKGNCLGPSNCLESINMSEIFLGMWYSKIQKRMREL